MFNIKATFFYSLEKWDNFFFSPESCSSKTSYIDTFGIEKLQMKNMNEKHSTNVKKLRNNFPVVSPKFVYFYFLRYIKVRWILSETNYISTAVTL